MIFGPRGPRGRTLRVALAGFAVGSALLALAPPAAAAVSVSPPVATQARTCDGLVSPRRPHLPPPALLGGPEETKASPTTHLPEAPSAETATLGMTPPPATGSSAVAPSAAIPEQDTQDTPIATASKAQAPQTISAPLVIDGRTLGEIDVAVDFADPKAGSFARLPLIDALRGQLTASALGRLEPALGAAPMATFAAAQAGGLDISFDASAVAVIVVRRMQDTPVVIVRGETADDGKSSQAALRPARLAGAVNVAVSRSYNWEKPKRAAWLPAQADIESFVTVGREHSVTFRAGGVIKADGVSDRRPILAIYDDPVRAVRYAAGQVEPVGAEFQSSPRLRGVMVGRAYQELQPYTNLAPTGRAQLTLDRKSLVTIEVDGIVTRSIMLERGRYDLRELSSTNGLNRVRILVEDQFGVREAATFDVLVNQNLLGTGISEFSLAVGSPEGGPVQSPLLATGYYRWAASPYVTALVGAQAFRRNLTAVAEALTPIPEGALRIAYGVSSVRGVLGHSLAATTFQSLPRVRQGSLFLTGSVVAQSPRFGAVKDEARPSAATRLLASGVIGIRRPDASYDFSAQISDSRKAADFWTMAASASRMAGRFSIGLTAALGKTESKPADARIGLSIALTRRAGPNIYTASISEREATAQWRSSARRVLSGRTELAALAQRSEKGSTANLTAGWSGPRLNVGAAHYISRPEPGLNSDARQNTTSATAAFGLGFADGAIAFGTPVRDAFAIATTHRSMGRAIVALGANTDNTTAKSGLLGPPMTNLEIYSPSSITYDVANLPDGYALGAVDASVFPRLGSGYRLRLGQANWMSARGELVSDDGPLASRRIVIARKQDHERNGLRTEPPIETFTNAEGVFYVEGVGPGAYVVMAGDAPIASFTIAPKVGALADLGTLKVTPP